MNKLRLIKIYELRGKIHPIEATIINLLDGIEEDQQFADYIVYRKGGITYFAYNLKHNELFLYPYIYTMFKCTEEETNEIMKYLLEKHLKITINIVW